MVHIIKGVFSPNTPFLYERARLAPHELIHVRAPPGDWAAGWAQAWREIWSSEALAEQQPAVVRSLPGLFLEIRERKSLLRSKEL